eukprot:TRINITY_DN7775_c0_g2_i5.p1 TRINITY_DN7775_c0_g2~~TRINITY_DN7775_c0_g2_i5.p1  ORF type:complete len:260 (+),score=42.35 TRINITY_DN7775_c0_g2_i5:35-814(+)
MSGSHKRAQAHLRKHGVEPTRSVSFTAQEHEPLPKVYKVYPGVVRSVKPYGAYVEMEGFRKHGLVHISQLSKFRVNSIEEVVSEGQTIFVKVIGVGEPDNVKISLSTKTINQTNGQDDDLNHVIAEQDKLKSKSFRDDEVKRVELGAVLNTTCNKCGTRGHLAKDCFSQGKAYALVTEEDMAVEPADKKVKKNKHKKHKKHKSDRRDRDRDDKHDRHDRHRDRDDDRRDHDDRRRDKHDRDRDRYDKDDRHRRRSNDSR